VRVEWDPEAPLTPIGQAAFFIEFLKASGVFDALVADCPLDYMSPNAPNKRDVLGAAVLSMLSDHKRHAPVGSQQEQISTCARQRAHRKNRPVASACWASSH
jgi:hypothetical protein